MPDDPISEFIMTFSNVHLLIFLVVIVVIAMAYLVRKVFHSNGKIVHFNDIDSPYPVTLVLLVSISAAFYGWIQSFEPEMWRHFYFHPSLNPFAVPHLLGVFLALVWAVLIVALACVDEVYLQCIVLILYRICLAHRLYLFCHQGLSPEIMRWCGLKEEDKINPSRNDSAGIYLLYISFG